jgi:hypothetical protein
MGSYWLNLQTQQNRETRIVMITVGNAVAGSEFDLYHQEVEQE